MELFRRDLPFSTMQMGPSGEWVSLALCDLGKAPHSPGPGLLLCTMCVCRVGGGGSLRRP